MAIILITGGARSGKSLYAEGRCLALAGRPVYLATAEAGDAEMAARIARHRARRAGQSWLAVEEPLALAGALRASDGAGPRLVDCLTLWLANLMAAGQDWAAAGAELAVELGRQTSPVILVSNEVGLGIVPDNALARAFRDAAGTLNQTIARAADEVVFVVAGLPMKVKG